ncbi:hypothetical protein ACIQVL_29590 [Streptomyces sp. NPDC090499]
MWLARAKRADDEADGSAAEELLLLYARLNARRSPSSTVEEVFSTPAPKR